MGPNPINIEQSLAFIKCFYKLNIPFLSLRITKKYVYMGPRGQVCRDLDSNCIQNRHSQNLLEEKGKVLDHRVTSKIEICHKEIKKKCYLSKNDSYI